MNYFSAEEQKKYCSSCNAIVSLKKFRVVNFEREVDQSSRYCSHCRSCESERAKLNQKARYKNCIPSKIDKLKIQIARCERQIHLLKEKQLEG